MSELWTIDGFESLTKQQLFDLSVGHVLKQGVKCRIPNKGCRYDGPNGQTCAAGIFLKPRFRRIADSLGDSRWTHLPNRRKQELHWLDEFVRELQICHDMSPNSDPGFLSEYKIKVIALAKKEGLSTQILSAGEAV